MDVLGISGDSSAEGPVILLSRPPLGGPISKTLLRRSQNPGFRVRAVFRARRPGSHPSATAGPMALPLDGAGQPPLPGGLLGSDYPPRVAVIAAVVRRRTDVVAARSRLRPVDGHWACRRRLPHGTMLPESRPLAQGRRRPGGRARDRSKLSPGGWAWAPEKRLPPGAIGSPVECGRPAGSVAASFSEGLAFASAPTASRDVAGRL